MAESTKLPRRPDLFSLAGRTALVTGASSGFGRRFAQVLASAGAKVGLAARRIDVLRQLEAEIRADGGQAQAFAMDVTDRASVAGAVAETEAALGPVTVLVNNAGIPSGAFFTKTTEEEWRSVMSVNLDGAFHCTRAALPAMLAANHGRIVNISSTAGLRGYAYCTAYCAAKHGLVGFTRALALEVAKTGITVNAVCPGYTDTGIVRDAVRRISEKTARSDRRSCARVTAGGASSIRWSIVGTIALVVIFCSSISASVACGSNFRASTIAPPTAIVIVAKP